MISLYIQETPNRRTVLNSSKWMVDQSFQGQFSDDQKADTSGPKNLHADFWKEQARAAWSLSHPSGSTSAFVVKSRFIAVSIMWHK